MNVTRLFLRLHKWIGIGMGVIVFVWLVSGMVMILPFTPIVPKRTAEMVDMRQAVIAPAAAMDLVGTREGNTSGVRRLVFVAIGPEPYYKIDMKDGKSFLLSAATGARLVINREVAERIARRDFSDTVPVRRATEISRHSFEYPGGALPAWRLEFDDARGTIAYVSKRDGSVTHGHWRSRVRAFVSGLHTFEQIELVGGSERTKKLSLHLTSLITIALVLTGYYVVLPRRWRRRLEIGRDAPAPAVPRDA
ncbi:MAG TPA: PepSY domain-containing protein [Gemmatimonadaceae bacterium]|nr:PepSY domain-containing protein [Gemmatimonadaceae bacterium]